MWRLVALLGLKVILELLLQFIDQLPASKKGAAHVALAQDLKNALAHYKSLGGD